MIHYFSRLIIEVKLWTNLMISFHLLIFFFTTKRG